MEQVVKELHKPARRNFPRKTTIIKEYDDLWQADLGELGSYAKDNRSYRFVLLVIDAYSKFIWTKPLKSKSGVEVTKALDSILKKGRIPNNIQTDMGKEFYNKEFSALMKKHNINHYSTYSVKKAAIAERAVRTIKTALYKAFSLRGKYKWIDILDKITAEYNSRCHRTTGKKPKDVTPSTKLSVYNNNKQVGFAKYKVGDHVRISKFKSIFAKGYTPNWSAEIFKIDKIKRGKPVTYLLKDVEGKPILGQFYSEELQKTNHPNIFLIEKVLRRKGSGKNEKLFVRWLGLSKSQDSWINKTNILNKNM